MANLMQKIQGDMVTALKSRDTISLSVLRMLKSSLQMALVAKGKDTTLTDEEIYVVIRRLVKQRKESAEMYESGNAHDRAASELAEAKILEAYLPAQLSDEELTEIVSGVIVETGAVSMRDMGKVMPLCIAKTSGRAGGKRIKDEVVKLLSTKK